MFAALLLLASPQQSDFEAAKAEIYDAIWYDIQLNAMIGNGNELGWLWYNAGADKQVDGHIEDLKCARRRRTYHCTFILLRDGGAVRAFNEDAPDRIACSATFHRQAQDADIIWMVRHTPSRQGHSRTTMKCRAAPLRAPIGPAIPAP